MYRPSLTILLRGSERWWPSRVHPMAVSLNDEACDPALRGDSVYT